MKRRWLRAAVMAVLVAGALAQWLGSFQTRLSHGAKVPLGVLLPSALAGWSVADQPISDSPEMKRAVGELLNFDDAVFRSYRQGAWQFAVYVAYWKPGRMPRRDVASHTPDVCWILGGWAATKEDFGRVLQVKQQMLRPAQYRLFSMSAQSSQHVMFWHLADGDVVTYRNGRGVGWWATVTDVIQFGTRLKPEQVFVRISSDTPFERLEQLEGFRQVVRSLLPLGLMVESRPAK